MEKISIIIPVYNVEKYIERCLDSIVNQSYSNLEIILVDDGSTDLSGEICDSYKSKDNRIIVIHKNNEGLGYARNSGLKLATGEFIMFVDGDDCISTNHVEEMVKAVLKTSSDTCLAGHTKVYNNKKISHVNVCSGMIFFGDDVKKQILTKMVGSKPDGSDYIEMSVCMALFSKRLIDQHNIKFHSEKEFISEDLLFNFDYYLYSQKVVVISDVGYYYYDNGGSLTTKYDPCRFLKQKNMTKEVVKRAKKLEIYDFCSERIDNTFISIMRYCVKLEQKNSKRNYKVFFEKVKLILEDEFAKDVLNRFNNKEVPIKSKIINIFMKNVNILFLWIAMNIKNYFNI